MNKTYLKVGVALTAAFAFGFIVGQAVLLRKVDELVKNGKENLEAVRDELIFQSEKVEKPVEEEKEEEEVSVLRRLKKMGIIPQTEHAYEVPYEAITNWSGCFIDGEDAVARKKINVESAKRIEDFLSDLEDADVELVQAMYRIQKRNVSMIVEDITPYPMRKDCKTLRFVYIRNENKLHWHLGAWRSAFTDDDVWDIMARLMTFSVIRNLESGRIYQTSYTPMMVIDQTDLHFPDDEVELQDTRIFFLPDIATQVEIVMLDKDDFPGRVRTILDAHA